MTLLTLQSRNDRDLLSAVVTADGNLAIEVSRNGEVTELEPITRGEWHRLQLHVAIDGTRGSVEVWYDGDLIFSDTLRTGSSEIEAIRLGDTSTDRTFDVAFDNLAVDAKCIGACSNDLVESAEPTTEAAEPSPEPTRRPRRREEQTPAETPVPTDEPVTTEPTATPTPVPDESEQVDQADEEASGEDSGT